MSAEGLVAEEPKHVLSRAFRILGAFRPGEGVISLAELARRSDLPKSTVHRIASSLVEDGALERIGSDFRLGLRLFELGGMVPQWRNLREAALPFMQDLYQATNETVHLGILDRGSVVYLEKIRGHRNVALPSHVGCRLPPHSVGLGKALLAFSPPETVTEILRRPLTRRTPYTIVSAPLLLEQLSAIRKRGIAFDHEEVALGLQCAAAPILGRDGMAIAAISVSVPTVKFELENLASAVRLAAIGVARVLAGSLSG